jgi:hypothetical protein
MVSNTYVASAGSGRIASDIGRANRQCESISYRPTVENGRGPAGVWARKKKLFPSDVRLQQFPTRNALATAFPFGASSFKGSAGDSNEPGLQISWMPARIHLASEVKVVRDGARSHKPS